jgi:hypothetical protein
MNCRILPLILLAGGLLCCVAAVSGQNAPASNGDSSPDDTYSPATFRRELLRLSHEIENNRSSKQLDALQKTLPPSWTIVGPDQAYSFSTAPLGDLLAAGSAEKADTWVLHLEEIQGNAQDNSTTSASAHAQLNRILAGSEFAAVRPPGPLQSLRLRIVEWLNKMLTRLFGNVYRHPLGAVVLFWVLLLGAVAAIALLVYRFLTGNDRVESLQPSSIALPQHSWQEWVRAARQAADRNDFREAVHSAYWAAIVRLEETGAVPRDRAKTPREYLRFVSESTSAESDPERRLRAPLQALTSRFERIWYANGPAALPDFQDSLQRLQELGCPLD